MASLDMLFVIDGTGSMDTVIRGVKNNIKDTVDRIKETEVNTIVRIGFVVYRDYNDDTPFEVFEFTEDVVAFRDALTSVRAKGGDDTAEDVFTGLEKAAGMDWQSTARMIMHFADAPCHGTDYYFNCFDNYPAGDKHGRTAAALLAALRTDCAVNTYHFMHINSTTKRMFAQFQEEYPCPGWYKEENAQIPVDGGADHTMSHSMAMGALHSITSSRSLRMGPLTPPMLPPIRMVVTRTMVQKESGALEPK